MRLLQKVSASVLGKDFSRLALSLALMLALFGSTLGMISAADELASAPSFKADVPKIDPNADRKPEIKKPLQAGIQLNQQQQIQAPPRRYQTGASDSGRFLGKLRGGAKTADGNALKGRAADQGNNFNIGATSGFGIIGVKFVLTLGRPPVINRVFMGTPAQEVGLAPEDVIIAVDGVPTIGLSKEEVYDLIIGSPGTSVKLSIRRGGDFEVVSCRRMDINDITDPVVRRDYLTSM
jgi:C-terminal processing protease CtpA/Prc